MSHQAESSHSTEWMSNDDVREPGWLGRLVAPEGGGRPATVALLVALLGVGAFVGSMVLDWVKITLPQNFGEGGGIEGRTLRQTIVNTMALGEVYALVGIGLIGFVGSVITRPDLALRSRMGVTGVGVGLLSIAVSGTVNLQNRGFEQYGYPFDPSLEGVTTALEAGIFCAYGAAVLPVVAVWLAARQATRTARPAPVRPARPAVEAPEPEAVEVALPTQTMGPVGSVGGLTVSASEPLDLSVNPDAWTR